MFQSIRQRYIKQSNELAIDIAPLIDVVFILLIFFMVTASFVQDTGIKVETPWASSGTQIQSSDVLRVSISASGDIYVSGDKIDITTLQTISTTFINNHAAATALIIPDTNTASGQLVSVIDSVKLSGINTIAIATTP
jgi:biopolymer transport protein ExbD